MTPVRGAAGTVLCVLWLAGCGPDSSAAPVSTVTESSAPASARPEDGTRYGGRTLAEWRLKLKAVDPKSPDAAELVPGLMEIVGDRAAPAPMRQQAALTLGRIGAAARDAGPLLVRVLDEPASASDTPALWSAKALSYLGAHGAEVAPELIVRLDDRARPTGERLAILEAVGAIGAAHPAVLPKLVELLNEPAGASDAAEARQFRVQSAGALAKIGEPAAPATPALVRALEDADSSLRTAALGALGSLKSRGEIAIPQIADRLVLDESPVVQDAAGLVLAQIGPASAPVLVPMMRSDDVELRRRAVLALGTLRPATADAAAAVSRALTDDDAQVRLIAAESLWKSRAQADEVLPAIVRGIGDDDRNVRLKSARLLRDMGPAARAAVPLLQGLANDARPAVRKAAEHAISEIEKESE